MQSLINHIRARSDAEYYASSMPPPVAQQIFSSMKIIMGEDGTNDGKLLQFSNTSMRILTFINMIIMSSGEKRIRRLARNTRYFRKRLQQMGCIIYGNDDSPVVPMLVYMYSKVA